MKLESVEEAIEEIRLGRMVIVADDEDRETKATWSWPRRWSRPTM